MRVIPVQADDKPTRALTYTALMTWRYAIAGYLLLLVLMSVVTFIAFAWDKRRARRGGWRISEKTLHTLELLGGWPGAWLGMRWLGHKSSKRRYRVAWSLILAVHVGGVAAMGWWLRRGW